MQETAVYNVLSVYAARRNEGACMSSLPVVWLLTQLSISVQTLIFGFVIFSVEKTFSLSHL
jgi:multisubunit Na+/H+ antiporter MnhE subunit